MDGAGRACDIAALSVARGKDDFDGIADGTEDRNRNGTVEPDETDPTLADSDGDAVQDGIDPRPTFSSSVSWPHTLRQRGPMMIEV